MLTNCPVKGRGAEKIRARERYLQMCVWFAEMRTADEVVNLIVKTYPEIESYNRVTAYRFSKRPRWAKIIRFLQERILIATSKIPITNKTIRLMRRERVYQKAMTPSLKSISQFGKVYELKLGAALNALDSAAEEIDGKRRNGAPAININASISIIQQLHQAAEQYDKKETDLNGDSINGESKNRLRIIK